MPGNSQNLAEVSRCKMIMLHLEAQNRSSKSSNKTKFHFCREEVSRKHGRRCESIHSSIHSVPSIIQGTGSLNHSRYESTPSLKIHHSLGQIYFWWLARGQEPCVQFSAYRLEFPETIVCNLFDLSIHVVKVRIQPAYHRIVCHLRPVD